MQYKASAYATARVKSAYRKTWDGIIAASKKVATSPYTDIKVAVIYQREEQGDRWELVGYMNQFGQFFDKSTKRDQALTLEDRFVKHGWFDRYDITLTNLLKNGVIKFHSRKQCGLENIARYFRDGGIATRASVDEHYVYTLDRTALGPLQLAGEDLGLDLAQVLAPHIA